MHWFAVRTVHTYMYIVYIRSLLVYLLWFGTCGLRAIQRVTVKDLKQKTKTCVWQLLKSVLFETYPAHALKRKRVIFIATVSSTMIIFVHICWGQKNGQNFKKKLIYFILYTCRAFTNYFSKLMCLFFFSFFLFFIFSALFVNSNTT